MSTSTHATDRHAPDRAATVPDQPPTHVPDDETPAGRCPYCDRPMATEQLLALHVGESHPDALTDAEREAYEDAKHEESDDLFIYHLKVVGGLMTLWAAFVIAYMVVLGSMG